MLSLDPVSRVMCSFFTVTSTVFIENTIVACYLISTLIYMNITAL